MESQNICLYLTYFTQHNIGKVHPCCSMYQYFILLWLNNIPLCVHHILFIHSSVGGHWVVSTFWLLCCCVHGWMQVATEVPAFTCFGKYLGSGIARLYGNSLLNFLRTTKLFSTATTPFYSPTSNAPGFQFLHIFVILYFPFFYNSHPNGCEVVCGFDLHFSND